MLLIVANLVQHCVIDRDFVAGWWSVNVWNLGSIDQSHFGFEWRSVAIFPGTRDAVQHDISVNHLMKQRVLQVFFRPENKDRL